MSNVVHSESQWSDPVIAIATLDHNHHYRLYCYFDVYKMVLNGSSYKRQLQRFQKRQGNKKKMKNKNKQKHMKRNKQKGNIKQTNGHRKDAENGKDNENGMDNGVNKAIDSSDAKSISLPSPSRKNNLNNTKTTINYNNSNFNNVAAILSAPKSPTAAVSPSECQCISTR